MEVLLLATMRDESYILYIFGAIIGFLTFAISMNFVNSESTIFILIGTAGMVGMAYCVSKIAKFMAKI